MEENKSRGNYGGYYKKQENQADTSKKDTQFHQYSVTVNKPTSLGTLIVWNISKALDKSPDIDLRSAMHATQAKLGEESRDVSSIISSYPGKQHLACALLAWQQLGHNDADSLYHFYETNKFIMHRNNNSTTHKEESYYSVTESKQDNSKDGYFSKKIDPSYDSFFTGPVVKLPVQAKIVMRLENTSSGRQTTKKQKRPDNDIKDKIEAACCMDTECIERLAALDSTTTDLRTRAAKLAHREAERVALLERAETAWKDLELGYQRRLGLAEEKEYELSKQIQNIIDERNGYKTACLKLAQHLNERGELAERERGALTKLEKEVCGLACNRLRLSEECARMESILNENQIKMAQLDRDLQFKEEQARHKLFSIEGEVSSARALTLETERAMRAELGALREQVAQVSDQLLEEESENDRIKQEINALEKEKMEMIEDLDGCKVMCDNRMQGRVDELQKKRAHLNELNDQVMECRCKLPIDVNVEVKRTPSLAALCKCIPDENILESCSCTSLRSTMLSNLLADLFGGLQTEISGSVSKMPCQLLKCLEDKHNWDRTSIVKTNLQIFFSQLLIAELDIAIATSIEKYHAKWVGSTCADRPKLTTESGEHEHEGWQERAFEQRAQKLASQLAEQLFQERAEQVTQRAKDIIMSGPPPCNCTPQAIYPCLVKSTRIPTKANEGISPNNVEISDNWRRTRKDITQLKLDMENIKKRSIKKGDIKLLEENIEKIMDHVSGLDTSNISPASLDYTKLKTGNLCEIKKPKLGSNNTNIFVTTSKQGTIKKKKLKTNAPKKVNKSVNISSKCISNTINKSHNEIDQSFAAYLCLCGTQNTSEEMTQQSKLIVNSTQNDTSWKKTPSKLMIPHISGIKQTKPINTKITNLNNKVQYQLPCQKDCACFNKLPSNTSIDRLLSTLTNWKSVLTRSAENYVEGSKTNVHVNHLEIIDNIKNDELNSKNKLNKTNVCQDDEKSRKNTCSESHVNKNDICSVLCNENQGKITKSYDQENTVLMNSDSQYMTAVNLDKSYNNCSQCLINPTKMPNVKNENPIKFPFKCINTSDCIYKQSSKSMQLKPMQQKIHTTYQIKNENNNCVPQSHTSASTDVIQLEENASITQNMQNDTEVKNINKNENSVACACDYSINFLGVTLANNDSQIQIKLPEMNQNRENKISTVINYCEESNNNDQFTDCVSPNVENKSSKSENIIANNSTYNEYDRTDLTSTCKDNILTKHVENKFNNGRETTSVNNLQDIIHNQKSCVCCNFNSFHESKNLEENAFNLLEEYLKEKLNDFHKFACKSPCSLSNEEGELFCAILNNVKKVISEHLKQMTCKCSKSNRIEGKWNRAYGLLQEYLRIKIKKVQCLCITRESDSLPVKSVLDKVSSLIDHDIERLRTMCRCNVAEVNNKISSCSILYKEEIRVKDSNNYKLKESLNADYSSVQDKTDSCRIMQLNTNSPFSSVSSNNYSRKDHNNITTCFHDNYLGNNPNLENLKTNIYLKTTFDTEHDAITLNKCSIETSNKSIAPNLNTSCQVPPNLGMVSKSCNGSEISTKNKQTMTIQPKNADNLCKPPKDNIECDCNFGVTKQYNKFLGVGKRELLVNHCTELENSYNNSSQINYVNKNQCNYPLSEKIQNTEAYEVKDLAFNNKKTSDKMSPYLGCTIECSCLDRNLRSCICLKSVVQENYFRISDIWKSVTDKSCLQKLSYIYNENTLYRGIEDPSLICCKNTNIQNSNNIIMSEVSTDIINQNRNNTLQRANKNVCDIKISVHGEEDIVLKNSNQNCEQMHNTTNTLKESIGLKSIYTNIENPKNGSEYIEMHKFGTHLLTHDEYENNTLYPFAAYFATDDNIVEKCTKPLTNQSYHDCHCEMVPVCHVKMLVENMESKLVNCSCTCDTLISDVCPVHSSNFS